MLKIGAILFAIGIFLISPLDEIFILIPLSTMVGLWIFPLFIFIAFAFLIIGAVLMGKHLVTVVANPIVMIMIVVAVVLLVWIMYENDWWMGYL